MSWLTAEEALQALKTKPQTLYANVSRGRIRAKADPADPRRSLYQAADVQRLAERHAGRRKTEAVAAEAIRWGDPVLSSAISTIIGGRLFYRGKDTAGFAEVGTLEQTAALLWNGAEPLSPAARPDMPLRRFRRRSWRWQGECHRICRRSAARRQHFGVKQAGFSTRSPMRWRLGLPTGRCISGLRQAGSGRRLPIACAARWCCLPITNSTHPPSRRGSRHRRVQHFQPPCCLVWRR